MQSTLITTAASWRHDRKQRRRRADYIVVGSGGDADQLRTGAPVRWIRKKLRLGAHLGSVADSAFYIARAGLLDDYACTVHWRSQPAFIEAFPHIPLRRTVYVLDRNRFTSAGRVGALHDARHHRQPPRRCHGPACGGMVRPRPYRGLRRSPKAAAALRTIC